MAATNLHNFEITGTFFHKNMLIAYIDHENIGVNVETTVKELLLVKLLSNWWVYVMAAANLNI